MVSLVPLTLIVLTAGPAPARAQGERTQHFEITGFGGIQFGGSTDLTFGNGSFDAGESYGGILNYRVREDGLFGVSYSRQQTTLVADAIAGGVPIKRSIESTIGYIHAGGELEIYPKRNLTPIIGLSVGATHISPRNGGESNWFFSAAFMGGFKYRVTKNFGLRTHMRLLATVLNGNANVVCVSQGGLTCAVSSGDVNGLIQGDLVAGLYLAF